MKLRRQINTSITLCRRELPQRKICRFLILVMLALLVNVLLMWQQFFSTTNNDVIRANDPLAGRIVQPREEEIHRETISIPSAKPITQNLDRLLPFHFPQNDLGLYKLEFVHIPKTGGTSIEMAASRVGIAWGMCKFAKMQKTHYTCRHINSFQQQLKTPRGKDWQCKTNGSPWHCPPLKYKEGNKFENVDTFAVVRNPYDRMISEYYYFFAKHDGKRHYQKWMYKSFVTRNGTVAHDLNDPEFMNRWIADAVKAAKSDGHCYVGHCVPFYKWVYAKNGTRVVSHVLRMENLTEEFEALMDLYQLPIKLEQYNVRKDHCTLGVEDLSADTIAKVNSWAKLDFNWFGYEMLDPKGKLERKQ